jgi:hypothetical protein
MKLFLFLKTYISWLQIGKLNCEEKTDINIKI